MKFNIQQTELNIALQHLVRNGQIVLQLGKTSILNKSTRK